MIGVTRKDNAVVAKWILSAGGKTTDIEYTFRVLGRSLLVEAHSSDTKVTMFRAGSPQIDGLKPVGVPYLLYGWHVEENAKPLVRCTKDGLFISHLWDYYNSESSIIQEPETEYVPDTLGKRRPLGERLFITVSRDFQEVLPNIPNPPSPHKAVAGRYVFIDMALVRKDALKVNLAILNRLKRFGCDYLLTKHHPRFWYESGGQGDRPFFHTLGVSSRLGGEQAVLDYLGRIKQLGYLVALYTDYVMIHPMASNWDERWVTRNPDNTWHLRWAQSFNLNPLKSWEIAAEFAPTLKAKFDVDATYCDQHTIPPPYYNTDYDGRKPFAAQQKAVVFGYGQALLAERQAIGEPVYSEGGHHWFYAGLADGSYAQLRWQGDRFKAPFLVDFDLLKTHPLSFDLGMGWRASYGLKTRLDIDQLDRFMCATIAFGHYGLIMFPDMVPGTHASVSQPLGDYRDIVLRIYFTMQQLQTFYAQEPVRGIRYFDGSKLVDTSAAVLSDAYRRNQVRVEYENGLVIYANGSFTDQWNVSVAGQPYVLGPTGYVAHMPGKLVMYSVVRNGRRVDCVDAPEYLYADGRGHEVDFGAVTTGGIVIVKKFEDGRIEVIPAEPGGKVVVRVDRFGMNMAKILTVSALDAEGHVLWEKPATVRTGKLVLKREGEVFSFQVAGR